MKVFAGQTVTGGEIIVRQRGTVFKPGDGVGKGKDDTLFAKAPGHPRVQDRPPRPRHLGRPGLRLARRLQTGAWRRLSSGTTTCQEPRRPAGAGRDLRPGSDPGRHRERVRSLVPASGLATTAPGMRRSAGDSNPSRGATPTASFSGCATPCRFNAPHDESAPAPYGGVRTLDSGQTRSRDDSPSLGTNAGPREIPLLDDKRLSVPLQPTRRRDRPAGSVALVWLPGAPLLACRPKAERPRPAFVPRLSGSHRLIRFDRLVTVRTPLWTGARLVLRSVEAARCRASLTMIAAGVAPRLGFESPALRR